MGFFPLGLICICHGENNIWILPARNTETARNLLTLRWEPAENLWTVIHWQPDARGQLKSKSKAQRYVTSLRRDTGKQFPDSAEGANGLQQVEAIRRGVIMLINNKK